MTLKLNLVKCWVLCKAPFLSTVYIGVSKEKIKSIFSKLYFLTFSKYLAESGNDIPIVLVYLANVLLDFPGILFCSCINVLIPKSCAAFITGYVTYPPTPITTSGLNSFIFFLALKYAAGIK